MQIDGIFPHHSCRFSCLGLWTLMGIPAGHQVASVMRSLIQSDCYNIWFFICYMLRRVFSTIVVCNFRFLQLSGQLPVCRQMCLFRCILFDCVFHFCLHQRDIHIKSFQNMEDLSQTKLILPCWIFKLHLNSVHVVKYDKIFWFYVMYQPVIAVFVIAAGGQ